MEYEITKHFYDRLNERFNVPSADADRWIKRFFAHAVKDHTEGRRVIYKLNEIYLIKDWKTNSLVTVYSKDRIEVGANIHNPEVKQVIAEALKIFRFRVIQRTARKIESDIRTVSELSSQIANARNFSYLDDKQTRIDELMIRIERHQAEREEILDEFAHYKS